MTLLEDFLLFDFPTWFKFGNIVLKYCSYAVFPVFAFALLFDKMSASPNPGAILKSVIIVQFVLILVPTYYKPVASFGIKVGNALLKDQKRGMVANWYKFQKRAEKKLKKKESDLLDTVSQFFKFSGTDIAEKALSVLILVCMLLIKVIYSVVYYLTYCTGGMLAVLSIFPPFRNHLLGVAKSILYLIITAILIALILSFMNQALDFKVSNDGFIEGLKGFAQFIVLCFVLLGTLKMGHSIVNGQGAESWSANMGSMLGAGLGYQVMSKAFGLTAKGSWAASKFAGSNLSKHVGAPLAFMASRPFSSAFSGIAQNLQKRTGNRVQQISHQKGVQQNSQGSTIMPLLKGQYENAFNQSVSSSRGAENSIFSVVNPVNHLRASSMATKNLGQGVNHRFKNVLGLPQNSKNLSSTEKAWFMPNKVLGGEKQQLLKQEELIKSQIIANQITKRLKKNGKS
jgi:hypothetical protein